MHNRITYRYKNYIKIVPVFLALLLLSFSFQSLITSVVDSDESAYFEDFSEEENETENEGNESIADFILFSDHTSITHVTIDEHLYHFPEIRTNKQNQKVQTPPPEYQLV